MNTQTFIETLRPIECYSCHVTFAMTQTMDTARRRDHKNFWCPNGHDQCYLGKTEEQKLREQLEAEQRRVILEQGWRTNAEKREKAAKRQASAARGQVTKIKKRVGNGICPCCNRMFVDLQRHMGTKHPDFLPRAEAT
jgi:hypothetical protein